MPLIALEILETKIKELLLIIKQQKLEIENLKKNLSQKQIDNNLNPEVMVELEKMKQLMIKYKNEKTFLITKLSLILKKIDEIIKKEEEKNG